MYVRVAGGEISPRNELGNESKNEPGTTGPTGVPAAPAGPTALPAELGAINISERQIMKHVGEVFLQVCVGGWGGGWVRGG